MHRRRRLKWWAGALAVHVGVMGLIWASGWVVSGRSGAGEMSARLDRMAVEAIRMQSELQASEPRLIQLHHEVMASRAVSQQPDWSILLAALGRARGDEIVLQGCRLTLDRPADSGRPGGSLRSLDAGKQAEGSSAQPSGRYELEVQGMSDNQAAVSTFILELEQTGLFDSVGLVRTERTTHLTRPAVAFTVECALAG